MDNEVEEGESTPVVTAGAMYTDDTDNASRAAPSGERQRRPPPEGGGMPLVQYQCRHRKRRYDTCVQRWYANEFLTGAPGSSLNQQEVCGDVFDAYRHCIQKGIRREIWDKQLGLAPPAPGSALADVDDDE